MIEGTPTTPNSPGKGTPWRNRRRIALLVVAAVALVCAGVVGGVAYENRHWQPLYTRASNDLRVAQNEGYDFQMRAAAVQDELGKLQQQIGDKVGNLDHPTFVLWNSCGSGGPAAGCYSYRRAMSGSTVIARRPGMALARNATISSIAATPVSTPVTCCSHRRAATSGTAQGPATQRRRS